MDLEAIITEVADEADSILSGVFARKDARTILSEHLQINHDELPPDDRLVVIRGVMDILQKEGFFRPDSSNTESVWAEGSDTVDVAET